MHPTLLLPEIVSMALVEVYDMDSHDLYSCLLVNRLFFTEAARLIWAHGFFPMFQSLVRTAREDPMRGRIYSVFIQDFYLDHDLDPVEFDLYRDPIFKDSSFPQLAHICLRDLRISSTKEPINNWDVLSPLLGSAITALFLGDNHSPSDSLLHAITLNCPNLHRFSLGMGTFPEVEIDEEDTNRFLNPDLSEAGMIEFLQSAHKLAWFEAFTPIMRHIWSKAVFKTLANLPNLARLYCPKVGSPDWMVDLYNTKGFPRLQSVSLDTSLPVLQDLSPFLSDLESLEIRMAEEAETFPTPTSHSALSVVTAFFKLKELHIIFPEQTRAKITAHDLLNLSQTCPELRGLSIHEGRNEYWPTNFMPCVDIDDSILDQVARNLPSLKSFVLCIDSFQLTNASFASLCFNCPQLDKCRLACSIDLEVFLSSFQSELERHKASIMLRDVLFYVPSDHGLLVELDEPDRLAKELLVAMPSLQNISFFISNHETSRRYRAVERAFQQVVGPEVNWIF